MIQNVNKPVKRPSVIMPVPVISDKQNDKRKLADAIIRKWNKKLNFRLGDFSPPPLPLCGPTTKKLFMHVFPKPVSNYYMKHTNTSFHNS